MGNILIQIASYRDPELPKTIKDLLDKKSGDNEIVISVVDQSDELINSKYIRNYEFVPYKQTEGVCWARAKLQKTYNNEDFTLMLDSHHRFVENWDRLLINEWEDLYNDGENPLITTYLPSYDPNNNSKVVEPWQLNFDRFTPEGVVFTMPAVIPGWQAMSHPVPTQFFSAHFAFVEGEFCNKVPYDPNYYFHGEEINMAVRAFTHVYDLYTPHELIAWHEYTRVNRTKQWDDDPTWSERNRKSLERNMQFFGIDNTKRTIDFDDYDFGTTRTLQEYEEYAGIRFKDRAVSQKTIEHEYPSSGPEEQKWSHMQRHCINVPTASLPGQANFCVVAFKNERNVDIYREDAGINEIKQLISDSKDGIINLWRSFDCAEQAKRCVVWPHTKEKGWGQEMSFDLGL